MNIEMKEVFLVGQIRALVNEHADVLPATRQLWELTGIFANEDEAKAACTSWSQFVWGPITLGSIAPLETEIALWPVQWPISRPHDSECLPGEEEYYRCEVEAGRMQCVEVEKIEDTNP